MNFHKTAGQFRSSDGKHILSYYVYTPTSGEVRAVLQLSHGMCEFIERYEPFAEYLCGHGILVCGNDHLGHGKAAQLEGTLGWFARKDGDRFLVEDLRKLTVLIQKKYPDLPYFLLGHSMGSFVARQYIVKYGELLDGVILVGTSGGRFGSGFGVWLSKRIAGLHNDRYISRLLTHLSMGAFNRRFKSDNDENAWISREVENRRKYAANPLCTFTFTASGYRDLFTLLHEVSAKDWAGRVPKELPVLLLSGTDDPVGNYGKGVQKVFRRLRNAGVKDVSIKLYEGDRHEILNEADREQVYADVLAFIKRLYFCG